MPPGACALALPLLLRSTLTRVLPAVPCFSPTGVRNAACAASSCPCMSCWVSQRWRRAASSTWMQLGCGGMHHTRISRWRGAACTRPQSLTRPCPCATCIWLLHPAPTSAQDGFDPLQLALVVVFILPSISAKTSRALAVGITCNLCWWCFSCTN